MNEGLITGALYIDLKKAFDTVDHVILLDILENAGVRNVECEWFKSYFTNRKQKVKVDDKLSDVRAIQYGVPQGSILGPLLFIMYINTLPKSVLGIECKINLYADDAVLLFKARSPDVLESNMKVGLEDICNWLKIHKLTLNTGKTKYMIFGSKQRLANFKNVKVSIGKNEIERVSDFKYLGVILVENLTYERHIDQIAKKISRKIGFLRRSAKPYIPGDIFKLLCNALIMPQFDYCDVVWSNCSLGLLDRLTKLHNRMARMILGAHPRTHICDLFSALQWKDLFSRWHFHRMCEVFKCVHCIAPQYLSERFVKPNYDIMTRSMSPASLQINSAPLHNNSGKRTFQ